MHLLCNPWLPLTSTLAAQCPREPEPRKLTGLVSEPQVRGVRDASGSHSLAPWLCLVGTQTGLTSPQRCRQGSAPDF